MKNALIYVLVIFLPVCSLRGEEANNEKVNVMPKAVVEMLLDSYIFEELEAKNITLPEACLIINKELNKHLKVMDERLTFTGVIPSRQSDKIKKLKVFLHIKRLSAHSVIKMMCEQTGTKFVVRDGGVLIMFHDTDQIN